MEQIRRTEKIDSWIVALFLSESSICTSINAFITIPFISVIIMLLLLVTIVVSHKGRIQINFKCELLYIIVTCLLLLSVFINGLEFTQNYLLYFIAFGITSLLLVSLYVNYRLIFIDVLKLYFFVILIYFLKFRKSFLSSNDYWSSQMGIAYSMVIPFLFSFAYIYLNKQLFFGLKRRYIVLSIFEIIASIYIILFDCGTRGAIVSIIFGCGLIVIGTTQNNKIVLWILFAMIAGTVIFYQMDNILRWISSVFYDSDIRALRKFSQMLAIGSADNGRNAYYKDALEYFRNSPFIGNGIGYFESRHNGTYVHEILYELLCEYGLLGVIPIGILLARFFRNLMITKTNSEKVFVIILLGISSVLLFSSSYWLLPSFWFTAFIILTYKRRV